MNLYKGGLWVCIWKWAGAADGLGAEETSIEKYEDKNKKNISKADSGPRLAQSEAFPNETIYFLI